MSRKSKSTETKSRFIATKDLEVRKEWREGERLLMVTEFFPR
jgi:hypothetical protein